MRAKITILLIFIAVNSLQASRILFLFPTPSKSHVIIARAVSTALAEKGHDVTLMSPFTSKSSLKNHREIHIELGEGSKQQMNNLVKSTSTNFFRVIQSTVGICNEMGKEVMESKAMNDIMKERFDLLVVGIMFTNFMLGLSEHFNCPSIILSVQRHMSFTSLVIGNPLAVNVAPHLYIAKHDMNFFDRVQNFAMYGVDLLMYEYVNYHQRILYE
jgi:glucuronosyltransferase